MRLVPALSCGVLAASVAYGAPGQSRPEPASAPVPLATTAGARVADAYEQYLLARHLERQDDIEGAVAAYKRAAALDPAAAAVPAELAALYMRQNRVSEAMSAAEQALRISPATAEAHRVLGTIFAALSDTDVRSTRGPAEARTDGNAVKAIQHLERAIDAPTGDLDRSTGEPDASLLATLARMYVRTGAYEKAIPMLRGLVSRERGWQDGIALLAEAYVAAGKTDEGIAWLEEAAPDDPRLYGTLGDFYDRQRRWTDSAGAYALAVQRLPNNTDLKIRYASALLNAGGRSNVDKARATLGDLVSARPTDQRALYLLSQAQRRAADLKSAEATARRLIALNGRSPWGYYALAEVLQDRQRFQAIIDALKPAIADFRARSAAGSSGLRMLLPHLGFAYEQLGQYGAAIAAFGEAHQLAPGDPVLTGSLIQAHLSARNYETAIEIARNARADHPDDLRLVRLHAQALRQSGQPDRAVAVLHEVVQKQTDRPLAHVVLAQVYADVNRGAEAVRILKDAQAKFPADNSIAFELGAVLEKQKRYDEAEGAFRQILARDPDNAPVLNYLGYMLADRGERLDESVGYLKRALELDPENGSYLDSLGWAYFKGNKLDLAEDPLQRAAEQLRTNSVIQDHYGDLLFKLGRYDEAIDAWTRALAGDSDSIDRAGIDRKIRSARQKLEQK
jgi:tetratricopeptide (TPR) repeat protein